MPNQNYLFAILFGSLLMAGFLTILGKEDLLLDIDDFYLFALSALFVLAMLSPSARPFHPKSMWKYPIFGIFAGGQPVLVPVKESGVIRGISDEALDEHFPPSAQEAAEMEAADQFVRVLANLSLLEDREEKNRSGLNHFPKRWEARRLQGLVGRPKPAKTTPSNSELTQAINHLVVPNETSLVPRDRQERFKKLEYLETTKHLSVGRKAKNMAFHANNSRMRGLRGRNPIHQPRKAN